MFGQIFLKIQKKTFSQVFWADAYFLIVPNPRIIKKSPLQVHTHKGDLLFPHGGWHYTPTIIPQIT